MKNRTIYQSDWEELQNGTAKETFPKTYNDAISKHRDASDAMLQWTSDMSNTWHLQCQSLIITPRNEMQQQYDDVKTKVRETVEAIAAFEDMVYALPEETLLEKQRKKSALRVLKFIISQPMYFPQDIHMTFGTLAYYLNSIDKNTEPAVVWRTHFRRTADVLLHQRDSFTADMTKFRQCLDLITTCVNYSTILNNDHATAKSQLEFSRLHDAVRVFAGSSSEEKLHIMSIHVSLLLMRVALGMIALIIGTALFSNPITAAGAVFCAVFFLLAAVSGTDIGLCLYNWYIATPLFDAVKDLEETVEVLSEQPIKQEQEQEQEQEQNLELDQGRVFRLFQPAVQDDEDDIESLVPNNEKGIEMVPLVKK